MTENRSGSPEFGREVASRFGVIPSFFLSASAAPEIIEKIWGFARSAYFDNPIPSVLKERVFVYLSRFCEQRYCIVRHCAFLVGHGHAAGDPMAVPQSVEQAIQLLAKPTPWQRQNDAWLTALETVSGADWPDPGTELEDWLIAAASLVFVEGARSGRAREALRHAFGGQRFEYLLGLLTFIHAAHYWTVVHPGLPMEEDARAMLDASAELARLLLEDPEAARSDMETRLFGELEGLRDLNERRELEIAKQALEAQVIQKELLLKEVNHRVKNSLQVVASLLQLEVAHLGNTDAAAAMRGAATRVSAVAAVHERLYRGDDLATVALDVFVADLCGELGRALACPEIELEVVAASVSTDMAIPLALMLNELVTNAIRHGAGSCRVVLRRDVDFLQLIVSNTASALPAEPAPPGMGSRILRGLARQIGATLATCIEANGYIVKATIPLSEKQ